MKKTEFITKISELSHISKKQAGEILDTIHTTIIDLLKEGESVKFTGFGYFEVIERKATRGINPKTKESIDIPASKFVKFRPSQSLKDTIKNS